MPFNESLHNELILFVIKLQSSWVIFLKEEPLGKIYLINSWFFSIVPFCLEACGSQKNKWVIYSLVDWIHSILLTSKN